MPTVQTSFSQGPTRSEPLNAITKQLPSEWATKLETMQNRLDTNQVSPAGMQLEAALLLGAARILLEAGPDTLTAQRLVEGVELILSAAQQRSTTR